MNMDPAIDWRSWRASSWKRRPGRSRRRCRSSWIAGTSLLLIEGEVRYQNSATTTFMIIAGYCIGTARPTVLFL